MKTIGWSVSRAFVLTWQTVRQHRWNARRFARWRAGVIVLTALVGLLFIALFGSSRPATYTISATTETAAIVVRDREGVAVRLPRVTLWQGDKETGPELCCGVRLDVSDGSRISLARDRTGDLLLQVTWGRGAGGARITGGTGIVQDLQSGEVLRVGLDRPAPSASTVSIPATVLLAFRGQLKVGDDVTRLVRRTLLSGTVKVVEGAPVWLEWVARDVRYVVHEETLDPGDSVSWRSDSGNADPVVSGFIHVGSEDAIRVVAHAAAKYALVDRFGGASYHVDASAVERAVRDPFLIGIGGAFAALTALATLLEVGLKLGCEESRE